MGSIALCCFYLAHYDEADDQHAARGTYGRIRSRVRGAIARATSRRADEAQYVIVKDEDMPELANVVSAEPYQASGQSGTSF